MWNRVALLTAGLALGWSLVHFASAPVNEIDKHRVRVVLASVVGAGVIALLAAQRASAGLLGAAVFLVSALLGYVANARQVSRPALPMIPPGLRNATEANERAGVVLVVPGEPAEYEGPSFWARWARTLPGDTPRRESWFTRPWVFSRVRRAYATSGAPPAAAMVAQRAAAEMSALLGGDYVVQLSRVGAAPALSQVLVSQAEDGIRRVAIVNASRCDETNLWAEVSSSRVREAGVRVTLVSLQSFGAIWGSDEPARLAALWSGHMPGDALSPTNGWMVATAEAIRAAASVGSSPAADHAISQGESNGHVG